MMQYNGSLSLDIMITMDEYTLWYLVQKTNDVIETDAASYFVSHLKSAYVYVSCNC